jgi:beta-phosphoglucomutase-like phosphatase (HAD superfamily)
MSGDSLPLARRPGPLIMFPHRIEGVVFDMDGLLIDTEAVWRDAMIVEADALGAPMPEKLILSAIGLPFKETQDVVRAAMGPTFDLDAFFAGVSARAKKQVGLGIALKAGVIELLNLLDDLGLPRAIATSSSMSTVEAHLGPKGLLTRFDAVVARGGYLRSKPFPDAYLRAAEAIEREPSTCLALEDSYNGVRAANSAGMMTVMVPDLLEPTEEMHRLSVSIADTLHEVRALLEFA